ncbi:DUF2934 domain-containing protein [Telmatospirillum sp.]|uniref:DUF2934 domain-containing protein n=1 Tax=Telmatospirillum sp. TaxID=2079197 RepID=UPI00284614D3|nr:DUF2934 domain-containing protein [Telmatospirillum sp.]MDR3441176.1 DUF2934 domain-containing protein [Telmatospirillum sp.]
MSVTDQERIRNRAFEIWQSEGCPEGRDVEHWQRAEEELTAEAKLSEAPAKKATAKTVSAKKTAEPKPAKSTAKPAAAKRAKATVKA